MWTIDGSRRSRDCEGHTRRDFLKVGALGATGLTLPALLARRARAAEQGKPVKDSSVVWVWLAGGPTHIETFDPKMTAPVEYRSVTGEVSTTLPGVTLGGRFIKTAQLAERFAFVRSFSHRNSGHGGGTHWVMTGYDNRAIDNGGLPTRPAIGSILAKYRGPNHPVSGMPTYVRLGRIGADGAAFLGAAYEPFETSGPARQAMELRTSADRATDRRSLLASVDRFRRDADATGLMDGLDAFERQAFDLVLGRAPEAFDLRKEDPRIVQRYGPGLGQNLLLARRLCEAGCGFVTVNYGGWDNHGQLQQAMDRRCPQLDHAIATFVEDVCERGLDQRILLVVTGEFGRTPKINRTAGRDHWAPLSTLALAGGGLKVGQTVGESSPKADVPATAPISPQDLMATVLHVLGIERDLQYTNQAGRPVYMLEEGRPIAELV